MKSKIAEFVFGITLLLVLSALAFFAAANWLNTPIVYKAYPSGKIVDIIAYEGGKEVHKAPDWLATTHKKYTVVRVSENYKPRPEK